MEFSSFSYAINPGTKMWHGKNWQQTFLGQRLFHSSIGLILRLEWDSCEHAGNTTEQMAIMQVLKYGCYSPLTPTLLFSSDFQVGQVESGTQSSQLWNYTTYILLHCQTRSSAAPALQQRLLFSSRGLCLSTHIAANSICLHRMLECCQNPTWSYFTGDSIAFPSFIMELLSLRYLYTVFSKGDYSTHVSQSTAQLIETAIPLENVWGNSQKIR